MRNRPAKAANKFEASGLRPENPPARVEAQAALREDSKRSAAVSGDTSMGQGVGLRRLRGEAFSGDFNHRMGGENRRHIRLIATDLDGTLLRADETISERSRQALERAQAAGITVVLATGRPPRTMRSIAASAGLTGLAICANGAITYDLGQETIVQHVRLAPEIAILLVEQLRILAPGVCFAVEHGLEVSMEPAYLALRERSPQGQPLLDDALALCRLPMTKLIARHPALEAEALSRLAQTIAGAHVSATYAGLPIAEITAAGVDKAWALAALCERLGISAAEVIAFGDMPNDLPMLAWAGHAVAMANAHPDVLKQAHEITLSNMEDGVAVVLERLFADG